MNPSAKRYPVLILGIGNILLRDEGIGVRVIQAMQKMELPEGVELYDGGTAGADLLDIICDRKKLIIIDAMDADCEPGSILRLTPDDLKPQASAGISLHQIGLLDTLNMAKLLGSPPEEVIIIGIKPKSITPCTELSTELKHSIPKALNLILNELKR
ncbi:MAG: HyaD/HybD family hydrogenase maturation endopeptidase [Planctomycetota bacterium]|nr:MAG: HyaD/HybD family hydrogenase maturation endopeptidase [Planctomycetota bacterium]